MGKPDQVSRWKGACFLQGNQGVLVCGGYFGFGCRVANEDGLRLSNNGLAIKMIREEEIYG